MSRGLEQVAEAVLSLRTYTEPASVDLVEMAKDLADIMEPHELALAFLQALRAYEMQRKRAEGL